MIANTMNQLMLTATTDAATGGGGIASMLTMIIPLGLMILVFYFLLIRPERKRSKQMKAMLSNLQIADEVITSGGIVGRVLRVQDDTVLIETGGDKTRLRVLKSAIIENRTMHDAPAAIELKKKNDDQKAK